MCKLTEVEMIARKKYIGPEVDVWSIGVIFFILVCGYMPFDDSNLPKMFASIMSSKYKINPKVSPEARDLIEKMLKPKPEERFTLSQVMEHPWVRTGNHYTSSSQHGFVVTDKLKVLLMNEGFMASEIEAFQSDGRPGPVKAFIYLNGLFSSDLNQQSSVENYDIALSPLSSGLFQKIKNNRVVLEDHTHSKRQFSLPAVCCIELAGNPLNAWSLLKSEFSKCHISFTEKSFPEFPGLSIELADCIFDSHSRKSDLLANLADDSFSADDTLAQLCSDLEQQESQLFEVFLGKTNQSPGGEFDCFLFKLKGSSKWTAELLGFIDFVKSVLK